MEIQYTNRTVNIPERVTDISLERYKEITEEVKKYQADSNPLHLFRVVELVCNLTEEELDEFTIPDMNDLATKVAEQLKTYTI